MDKNAESLLCTIISPTESYLDGNKQDFHDLNDQLPWLSPSGPKFLNRIHVVIFDLRLHDFSLTWTRLQACHGFAPVKTRGSVVLGLLLINRTIYRRSLVRFVIRLFLQNSAQFTWVRTSNRRFPGNFSGCRGHNNN